MFHKTNYDKLLYFLGSWFKSEKVEAGQSFLRFCLDLVNPETLEKLKEIILGISSGWKQRQSKLFGWNAKNTFT